MTRTPASESERSLHNWVAGTALVLMFSGVLLLIPGLSSLVGLRVVWRTLHIGAALVIAVAPTAIVIIGRRELARTERQLSYWSAGDFRWFSSPGTWFDPAAPRTGRFNGGQKALALLVAVSLASLLISGLPMYWWPLFAADLVARANVVHVIFAYALIGLVAGHLLMVFVHRDRSGRARMADSISTEAPPGSG